MRIATEDIQTRAGLIASEFSLCGMGATLLSAAALLELTHGRDRPVVGRETALVAAGLLGLGTVAAVLGWWLDLGRRRVRSAGLQRTFPAVLVLGSLTALAAAWAALLPWPPYQTPGPWHAGTQVLVASGLTLAPLLLASLGLRTLGASPGPPAMPLTQLMQATSHTVLGGVAVLLVLSAAANHLTLQGRSALAAAVGALACHALLWSLLLLRGMGATLVRYREGGVRLLLIERAVILCGAVALMGLALPALVMANVLFTGREAGLLAACAVAAASNHIMRYALATVSWPSDGRREPPVPAHAPAE